MQESFEELDKSEGMWEVHRKKKDISTGSCPKSGPYRYDKVYETFIMEHFPRGRYWKHWEHYSTVKALKGKLDANGTWTTFGNYIDESVNQGSGLIDNETMASLMTDIGKLVYHPEYKQFYNTRILNQVFMAFCKLAWPLVTPFADDQDRPINCVLTKATVERIKLIDAPMATSSVVTKRASPADECAASETSETVAGTPAKKRRVTKGKTPEELVSVIMDDDPMLKNTAGQVRNKRWLDTLISSAMAPTAILKPEDAIGHIVDRALVLGGAYLILGPGEVSMGTTKSVTNWSDGFKALRKYVVNAHLGKLQALSATATSAEDVKQLAAEFLRTDDEAKALAEAGAKQREVQSDPQAELLRRLLADQNAYMEDQGFVGPLINFLATNVSTQRPVKYQPAYRQFIGKIFSAIDQDDTAEGECNSISAVSVLPCRLLSCLGVSCLLLS